MSQTINTREGCKYWQIAGFLHPSGAPLIDIYQAGAQRTLGAVASPLLLLTLCALPALRRLHPSHAPLVAPFAMSPIAPFNLAGRALHTGDTTSRMTTEARGAGLHRAHPMHHVHHQEEP